MLRSTCTYVAQKLKKLTRAKFSEIRHNTQTRFIVFLRTHLLCRVRATELSFVIRLHYYSHLRLYLEYFWTIIQYGNIQKRAEIFTTWFNLRLCMIYVSDLDSINWFIMIYSCRFSRLTKGVQPLNKDNYDTKRK